MMTANSIGAMLQDHVPEGARFPQIALVNMPSAEVGYVTQYLFEFGEGGLKPSTGMDTLYREIDKILSRRQNLPPSAPPAPEQATDTLLDRVNALRDRIQRAKPQGEQ